jgi:aspartyl-tRNA(Asn)/glutamyl-tRNA(Gln) amidotransferase subunit C
MKLSRQEVLHIASLARLGLDEAEVEMFGEQLSKLLDNFEILQQADTDNTKPTAQSIALNNVIRDDEAADSLPASDVLANAPQRDGDYFRIHPVLGDS